MAYSTREKDKARIGRFSPRCEDTRRHSVVVGLEDIRPGYNERHRAVRRYSHCPFPNPPSPP